ncbi:MAG: peptidoglycan DD-metalloendopeptidase family protein [Candidatus Paceibacterota bacterium]|jgi:murein DD-endopeptidase MepM/ murein hydrolase activator NlpD
MSKAEVKKILPYVFLLFFSFYLVFFVVNSANADAVSDLQTKIADRNKAIADLEKEIADYQKQIDTASKDANSLANTIKTLDISRKKLNSQIAVTENQITEANLTIEELGLQIGDKTKDISNNSDAIANSMRKISTLEDNSLPEILLNYNSISEFFDRVDTMQRLQKSVEDAMHQNQVLKTDLESKQQKIAENKQKLVTLKVTLADQKKVVEYATKEKNDLLSATKNKESSYKKILTEKVALRDAFEKELLDYESQLKFVLDPKSIPSYGTGVLKWPMDVVKITQAFGNTDFASKNPQIYNGKGHNGVDFGVPIGTPIKAVMRGKVRGAGDTDPVCPGASYGKWVLIDHPNGLSSIYAHLSLIKVSAGQEVQTGEVVAYSGKTGYSTGPHLHLSVLATAGVEIISKKSAVCSGTYVQPAAALTAYLNPLSYLP